MFHYQAHYSHSTRDGRHTLSSVGQTHVPSSRIPILSDSQSRWPSSSPHFHSRRQSGLSWTPNTMVPPQRSEGLPSTSRASSGLQSGSGWTPDVSVTQSWDTPSSRSYNRHWIQAAPTLTQNAISTPKNLRAPVSESCWTSNNAAVSRSGGISSSSAHPYIRTQPGSTRALDALMARRSQGQSWATPSATSIPPHAPNQPQANHGLATDQGHGVQQLSSQPSLNSFDSPPELQRPLPGIPIPQERYRATGRHGDIDKGLVRVVPFNLASSQYLGVPLMDILNDTSNFAQLIDAHSPFPHSGTLTCTLRILWPGYKECKTTFSPLNWRKIREPKTQAKIAQEVAKAILKLLKVLRKEPLAPGAGQWNPHHIQPQHLSLLRLRRVSKNSWQPDICLLY